MIPINYAFRIRGKEKKRKYERAANESTFIGKLRENNFDFPV